MNTSDRKRARADIPNQSLPLEIVAFINWACEYDDDRLGIPMKAVRLKPTCGYSLGRVHRQLYEVKVARPSSEFNDDAIPH